MPGRDWPAWRWQDRAVAGGAVTLLLGCVLDVCHADAAVAEYGGLMLVAGGDLGWGSLELGAAVDAVDGAAVMGFAGCRSAAPR